MDLKSNYLFEQILQEVYFGRTDEILAIQNQLDKFRRKYYKSKQNPKNDPDLLKLNRMIESQFGFGTFAIQIKFDPVPNAVTIPVSYNMDVRRRKNDYIVDASTYKFKKEYNYATMITMTTGLIFNEYFTTEEVMACILYELGRNFYACMSEDNAILSNIYSAVMIVNAIYEVIDTFMSISSDVKHLLNSRNDAKLNAEKAARIAELRDAYPEEMGGKEVFDKLYGNEKEGRDFTAWINGMADNPPGNDDKTITLTYMKAKNDAQTKTIKNMVRYGGMGIAGLDLIEKFTHFPIYARFLGGMQKMVSKDKATKKTFYNFADYIWCFGKHTSGTIFDIIKEKMFHDRPWLDAFILTGIHMLVPYKRFLATAKNPLTWITMPVSYKVERSADNFPTMYGYGAEMVSYFDKMKRNDRIKIVNHFCNAAPFCSIMFDLGATPARVLNGMFDGSPNGISKANDQIAMLRRELAKEDLDPAMKARISSDLVSLEVALKDITNISNGVSDPNLYRKLYNKALLDIFNGTDLKDIAFDSRSRFEKYDANYANKVG